MSAPAGPSAPGAPSGGGFVGVRDWYSQQSGGRQLTLVLLVVLVLLQFFLDGRLSGLWTALWAPTRGLGQSPISPIAAQRSDGSGGFVGNGQPVQVPR